MVRHACPFSARLARESQSSGSADPPKCHLLARRSRCPAPTTRGSRPPGYRARRTSGIANACQIARIIGDLHRSDNGKLRAREPCIRDQRFFCRNGARTVGGSGFECFSNRQDIRWPAKCLTRAASGRGKQRLLSEARIACARGCAPSRRVGASRASLDVVDEH